MQQRKVNRQKRRPRKEQVGGQIGAQTRGRLASLDFQLYAVTAKQAAARGDGLLDSSLGFNTMALVSSAQPLVTYQSQMLNVSKGWISPNPSVPSSSPGKPSFRSPTSAGQNTLVVLKAAEEDARDSSPLDDPNDSPEDIRTSSGLNHSDYHRPSFQVQPLRKFDEVKASIESQRRVSHAQLTSPRLEDAVWSPGGFEEHLRTSQIVKDSFEDPVIIDSDNDPEEEVDDSHSDMTRSEPQISTDVSARASHYTPKQKASNLPWHKTASRRSARTSTKNELAELAAYDLPPGEQDCNEAQSISRKSLKANSSKRRQPRTAKKVAAQKKPKIGFKAPGAAPVSVIRRSARLNRTIGSDTEDAARPTPRSQHGGKSREEVVNGRPNTPSRTRPSDLPTLDQVSVVSLIMDNADARSDIGDYISSNIASHRFEATNPSCEESYEDFENSVVRLPEPAEPREFASVAKTYQRRPLKTVQQDDERTTKNTAVESQLLAMLPALHKPPKIHSTSSVNEWARDDSPLQQQQQQPSQDGSKFPRYDIGMIPAQIESLAKFGLENEMTSSQTRIIQPDQQFSVHSVVAPPVTAGPSQSQALFRPDSRGRDETYQRLDFSGTMTVAQERPVIRDTPISSRRSRKKATDQLKAAAPRPFLDFTGSVALAQSLPEPSGPDLSSIKVPSRMPTSSINNLPIITQLPKRIRVSTVQHSTTNDNSPPEQPRVPPRKPVLERISADLSPAAPVQTQHSRRKRLRLSLSDSDTNSSTSDSENGADAHAYAEREWLAQLAPHQRRFHGALMDVSARLVANVAGRERTLHEIGETYRRDGLSIVSAMCSDHADALTAYESAVQQMKRRAVGIIEETLQRVRVEATHDVENIDACPSRAKDGVQSLLTKCALAS
ncbi:hypothetical protein ANO11243_072850 [Dothideomycetidae sp. 11243]|nr:hypothetical protein ANO11243_072850 [fungal sp. No.11243]